MNPYTSLWTGVRDGDGPREFHLVLLDNGRTDVLRDEVGRQALHCIRCSACLNVCPVYSRTGGQAYESVYPGPIGAILTPQLKGLDQAPTLPWASSLCGACYEACPVKIDIPSVLIHLRARVVREEQSRWEPERLAMDAVGGVFGSRRRYEAAQRLSKLGRGPLSKLPVPGWTRDARAARGARARPSGSGGVSAARAEVLGRIRSALGAAPVVPDVPRAYHPAGAAAVDLDLFCERVADYRAEVHRVARGGLDGRAGGGVRAGWGCAGSARRSSVDLGGVELVADDPPLSIADLDGLDGVLTGCALGIAETGTLVLDGAGSSGRRALTLVPDVHLCVIAEDQVVASVPDAVARARRGGGRGPADHAGVRSVGDVGYRARSSGGSAWTADARGVRRS